MRIPAIIIDDERKAIEILKNKIERHCPIVEIIGATQDPNQGIEMIEELSPDLIFLDVAMPEISGFELLEKIARPNFEIIFVTAFDQYAIDAINHCAIGYLLKPVDNEKLAMAVENARLSIENKSTLLKNKQLIANLGIQSFQKKKIVIPTQEGLKFILIDQIIYCAGVDGYTRIHLVDAKPILSSKSIGQFNKLLDHQGFYLIHKSFLINLDHITEYLNEGYVILSNGDRVAVARSKRTAFIDRFRSDA